MLSTDVSTTIEFKKELTALIQKYKFPSISNYQSTNENDHKLACVLGEIEEKVSTYNDIFAQLKDLGINCDKELDGYESIIELLFILTITVENNLK